MGGVCSTMGEMRNIYKIFGRKTRREETGNHFQNLVTHERMILKIISKK
jgi:hypothetical protein